MPDTKLALKSGFTLIEMSVVLVIIGLVVGGILMGQDLISAAGVRAQISQIEKYNVAVHTFQSKYGYLPGDIPDPQASMFGFQPRGTYGGEGDGNGVLEGNCTNAAGANDGFREGDGELAVLWEDLSEAGLIDATIFGFDTKGSKYPYILTPPGSTRTLNTIPGIKDWLPTAKLGQQNNFIYVWSLAGINYWGLSRVDDIGCAVESDTVPNITVQQAYMIDTKMDDGWPQSGSVRACYVNHQVAVYQAVWAMGGISQGASGGANCVPTTAPTVPATTDCYGNNNVAGAMQYSVGQNANLLNCALSFKFQ